LSFVEAGVRDPRHFQIAALGGLLAYGLFILEWEVGLTQVYVILATALVTQWFATRFLELPRFDARSALISGLSLCLLLRTRHLELAVLASAITILGKFVLRARGKHLFNPTNLGLVVMLLFTGECWVSAGQWGSTALSAFAFVCMGMLVVFRAERSDVTLAFLLAHASLLFGRALWLGDPLAIPIHQLESGALLLFAFFMISDPKTTPDSRFGRILFAVFVAVGAYLIRFHLFAQNALLYSLALVSLTVHLLDRVLPGARYEWPAMKKSLLVPPIALLVAALVAMPRPAEAMCGCMMRIQPPKPTQQQLVAQKILNESSKVAMVRDGETTIMTMSNDVISVLDEFGLIVPVPTVIQKNDVRVVEQAVFTALEQLTNPRLMEKWDPDPCPAPPMEVAAADEAMAPRAAGAAPMKKARAQDYGVKVEAHYNVGEYSIAVLSAKEGAGSGLMEWLNKFHYAVPPEAVPMLNSYIKQNMRFFVAKVDFRKVDRSKGRVFLRPIQVRYQTPKLMLPVRLGTINADGPQELVAYFLSPKGRIETTNYQTVRMPTGQDLPLYVKDQFEKTYQAIFESETAKQEMRAVFLEYVQRGTLPPQTYAQLGLGWGKAAAPGQYEHFTTTRLHFKYDRERFPEDLTLQETPDIQPFLVQYSVHHQSQNVDCEAGKKYLTTLEPRRQREAESLAMLTRWDANEIREKMGLALPKPVQELAPPPPATKPWWKVWD
jgi:Na+-translocating ferredoxin:NAD+ oxidoreductase RnfD subunit